MQQQPSMIGQYEQNRQCPTDEDFAREIENDPQLNQVIEQIIARIPPDACGVRPPRTRREERYVNSECPPRTATIRRRLPSPNPDIIERHTIIRSPQDTINIVIEKPGMPPPCVYDKTDYEPESPPRIQHAVVCVQPSSRCPPGSQPDPSANDDQYRQVPYQQQQMTGQQNISQQQQQQTWPQRSSLYGYQSSQYMPQQQYYPQQSQRYQFYPSQFQLNPSQYQRTSSQYQPVAPLSQSYSLQQQSPSTFPQQQQFGSSSGYQQQFPTSQQSNILPQQQQSKLFSSQITPPLQNIQSPSSQQGQQQQSYYWPQTQPQNLMSGTQQQQSDISPKTRNLIS